MLNKILYKVAIYISFACVAFTACNMYEINTSLDNSEKLMQEIDQNLAQYKQELETLREAING